MFFKDIIGQTEAKQRLIKEIQEVKNAYEAYEQIDKVNPYSVEDLKKMC
mgnify:CR=1 FL=1